MSTTAKNHAFKVEYIKPFIDSLNGLFVDHLGATITIGAPTLNKSGMPTYEVSGVIAFTGTVEGRVVVSFQTDVAEQIVKGYLQMDDLPEGVLEDCVGELANVIAGRAKSEMEQHQIIISPPTVIRGTDYQIAKSKGTVISVPCETSYGPVQVEISIQAV